MAIFKCKMCGGALEINSSETVIVCEYCGTNQTLPKLDDEKRANMYDRANHFRRNNEFDKAMGIYEQILNEDNTDAEAYWSLVLCRYGIEYVEDPATKKRIPTINRAQFTSIFDDEDYKSALSNADSLQKTIYEAEATAINEIQKGILAISQKEEPFDVFICYKETDEAGRRTPDSVLANDLYHQLTGEGFKVFFSRITLEDKLGQEYEPYIFAALNSAKVMVTLGTKPEYFKAVWVKNEWSRYLALIKNGAKKILIPAYKDMDPYDLPDEFSHLQAQDMSKLGFMQDLIRGIKKITEADEPKQAVVKETIVTESANVNTAPLLRRMFMFLEDGAWDSANEYAEKVLDIEPECAEAYLGKLMAEKHTHKKEELKNCDKPFGSNPNYNKVIRFGNDALKTELSGYIEAINDRNEKARLEAERKAEEKMKGDTYSRALLKMKADALSDVREGMELFESIKDYKDSAEKINECEKKIAEIEAEKERERLEAEEARIEAERIAKRNKKIVMITTPIVCAIVAFVILMNSVIWPAVERGKKYEGAIALISEGRYGEAISDLEALGTYKEAVEKIEEIKKLSLANPEVGDSVWFGNYEQNNDPSDGKEAIEWLVLDKQNNKALVISKYVLDDQPYSEKLRTSTWSSCTLRSWLNSYFIGNAFTSNEKAMIHTVKVTADRNPRFNTDQGIDTQDKVFLLSIAEVNKYFKSYEECMCKPTDYAVAKGAYVDDYYTSGNTSWWLRTLGDDGYATVPVESYGEVWEFGWHNDAGCGVRPALWIVLG